jgi:hypothetical protein
VYILVEDSSVQNLTPAEFVAAEERTVLAGAAPGTTAQAVTLSGMQGDLLFSEPGGIVTATVYSPDHPDSNLVFTLYFEAPEFATSYPPFWKQMLESLTLSQYGSNGCTAASCTCW